MSLTAADDERWETLKLQLREDLCAVPPNVAREKGFTEVRPGENDYDACFKAWWLDGVKRLPNGVLFVTIAEHEEITRQGLEKYRKRLLAMARRYFQLPKDRPVTISLKSRPGARPEPAFALESPAEPPLKTSDLWRGFLDELKKRLFCIHDPRQRAEAMENFQNAIATARLESIEMDGTAPVWTVRAPNAVKMQRVMGMLRGHVRAALRTIAGDEAQLIIKGLASE